jgi:hypothetical protein
MKVIIAGSRDISDYELVVKAVEDSGFAITEVVSGTARGVDRFGERWARESNVAVKRFPANWDKYGKRAGFLRNVDMADYADALIAVWNGSTGTANMISLAKKRGLKVFVRSV